MSAIPENVDYEIAKIWLSQQNLEDLSPEQAKELFFRCSSQDRENEC